MKGAFLAVLLLAAAGSGWGCPHAEFIVPCSCRPAAYGQHVVCSGLTSVTRLQNILKVLRDYKVGTLLLHEMVPDRELPGDLFSGMNIVLLRFVASDVKFSPDGPALRGLEQTLNNLDISRGQLSFGGVQLAPLTALQELYVAEMKVPEIRDIWLGHDLVNLKTLRLEKVDLHTVQDGAFAKLENLEHLSLPNNRLEKVSRNMLPDPAENLKSIDLSDNMISSLPEDFFVRMPQLTSVVLSGNDIETLPEQTWSGVWSTLDKLLLYDTAIICDERLNWIPKDQMPEQLTGRCTGPEEVRDLSLVDFLTGNYKHR